MFGAARRFWCGREQAVEWRRGAAALALRPRDGTVENAERRQPRLAAAVIAAVRVDVEHPAARGVDSRDVPERWRRLLLHEPQPVRSREHRARVRVLLPSLGKEAADRVAPILAPPGTQGPFADTDTYSSASRDRDKERS